VARWLVTIEVRARSGLVNRVALPMFDLLASSACLKRVTLSMFDFLASSAPLLRSFAVMCG
jgi:hypothetical protein